MSVQVAKSRFIVPSLIHHAGFYQQLLSNISTFQALGKRLIQEAEISIAFRQLKGVEEAALLLSSLPGEYRLIGHYYQGWYKYRNGENARSIFEEVIEKSKTYRAKALISLAAVETQKDEYSLAYKYYNEALKYANSPSIALTASRTIAAIKAREGFHSNALKDLEQIYYLARYADPKAYYDYLNSFAVELGEAGRIEEAGSVCKIILASPFINAYPEWRETGNDIALRGYKSRSSVSFAERNLPKNVYYLPERSKERSTLSQPGSVTSLAQWKKKMVKEPNGDVDENIDEMDEKDLIVKLLQLTAYEGVNEKKLRKIVKLAIKVMAEKD